MEHKPKNSLSQPMCGLCKNRKEPLIKTECCNNWICNDEHKYVVFSYAKNSCHRNHDRYTLCSYHFHENHEGQWQDCKQCKDSFDLPYYNDMATNQYNFEKLNNIEKATIKCANCGFIANSIDEFSCQTSRGYFCTKTKCQEAAFEH